MLDLDENEEAEEVFECKDCGEEITESMYEHVDHEINPNDPLCYECSIARQTCTFCENPATHIYGENYVCNDHGVHADY